VREGGDGGCGHPCGDRASLAWATRNNIALFTYTPVAELLTSASRALDAGDTLPPADRRREDTHKAVRDGLAQAKRML
jgi:hypothetical protein